MATRRMMRTLVLAVALMAALGFGKAAQPAAASGSLSWGYNQSTGCTYLTDGTVSYLAACPRGDGWNWIYIAQNGQWVYGGLVYWDAYNCVSFWDGGAFGFTMCPPGVSGDGAATSTLGGSYTSGGYGDLGAALANGSYLGGQTASTGNAVTDAIYNSFLASVNGDSLAPNCLYVDSTYCYVR